MKIKIIIVTLSIVCISCKNEIKKEYYSTGELKYENSILNDSTAYLRVFYKNGKIQKEGKLNLKNQRIGHWKDYYSDGLLYWEGDYIDGHLFISKPGEWPDYKKMSTQLEIYGNPDTLIVGNSYKIRIFMTSVDPTAYLVTYADYSEVEVNRENPDEFPYIITPKKTGRFEVLMTFPNELGKYIRYKSTKAFILHVKNK